MAHRGKKLDLIPELTTYKNDYKVWPLPIDETPLQYIEEPKTRGATEIPQTDYQSHLNYVAHVPFDLYIRPRPITNTNPYHVVPSIREKDDIVHKKDSLMLKVPGKPVQDVTDEEIIRNILINTYSPIHRKLYDEACLKVPIRPKQTQSVFMNDKVSFQPQLYPPLPPGWLEAAKHWDSLQSRILGDPSKTFWLRKGPEVECFSRAKYTDLITPETKREIRELIEEDKLRLPFNVTTTGYGGYRQISGKGVALRRDSNFVF